VTSEEGKFQLQSQEPLISWKTCCSFFLEFSDFAFSFAALASNPFYQQLFVAMDTLRLGVSIGFVCGGGESCEIRSSCILQNFTKLSELLLTLSARESGVFYGIIGGDAYCIRGKFQISLLGE
jgi:hypothetical protein